MANKNKAAKARRDTVAEKLKNVASTVAKQQQQIQKKETTTPQPPPPPAAADTAAVHDDAANDVLARAEARAAHNQHHGGGAFLTPAELHKAKLAQAKLDMASAENPLAAAANNNNNNNSLRSTTAAVAAASAAPASLPRAKEATTTTAMMSKRQRKRANQPTVEQLKSAAKRPDLVELCDTTAPDPQFLLEVKQMRNTVPVPSHWAQKSAFMSHTVDRDANSSFEATVMLSWIENMDIASAWKSKQASIHPRKLILPFVAGHEKPLLTGYGDLFYEGKDMRARIHGYQPGVMSVRLRHALDMGDESLNMPPPWLTGMQTVAKLPPSYPNLKVPGVNAPIPSGARYGKGRNEWGEPPRDPKNPSNFLFESVMRSNAAQADAAERKAEEARWGGGGGQEYAASYFTMSKAEADELEQKMQQEKQEQQMDPTMVAPDEATVRAAAQMPQRGQQASSAAPSVSLHALQQAGVVRGGGGQQQGQFAVEVNPQQHGGMHALLQGRK